MCEQLNIAEGELRACLREQYGLFLASLDFLPLGLNSKTAVYRATKERQPMRAPRFFKGTDTRTLTGAPSLTIATNE